MDTPMTSNPATPGLSRSKAWLVGGSLAGMALGSLATALLLQGPGAAPQGGEAEPRETIVSTMSPAPRPAPAARGAAADAAAPVAARSGVSPATAARPACSDCAVVQAVTAVQRRGEATGLGAVGGAVAGGVLGSQMGGGSGQDAMTVIGAVGGGVAGHHMERRLRSTTEYRVRVLMADGQTRTLSHPTRLAVGEAVRVNGDRLVATARPAPAAASTRTAQSPPSPSEADTAPRPRSMADAKRL